jgi:hypothetical protein
MKIPFFREISIPLDKSLKRFPLDSFRLKTGYVVTLSNREHNISRKREPVCSKRKRTSSSKLMR